MSSETDVLKKSVTQGDVLSYTGGPVFHFMLPLAMPGSTWTLPPEPPIYWSFQRDMILRATMYREDDWASALSIACTMMASKAWHIEGEVPLRVKRAQDLMSSAGLNKGWVNFITRHLQDYMLTDNGGFIEIVRTGTSLNSQIIGLVPLDSCRCQRTGDPDLPILYRDLKGRWHEMQSYQVIEIVDMPDPGEAWYGTGHCAAARAYHTIHRKAAIATHVDEKVTGRRPLSLYFVNGMNAIQIQNAVQAAQGDADAKGLVAYMGAVVVPVPGEKAPEVAEVPFSKLPDGYNHKEEREIALQTYANALGIDSQDLLPLTGQPLGTGAQSQVLDDKAKGKGLAAWLQAWQHAITWNVLPDLTTFAFIEKDYRDQVNQANVLNLESQYLERMVRNQVLSPQQALKVSIDNDHLPKEFMPEDDEPEEDLSDNEKIDAGVTEGNPATGEQEAATPAPAPVPAAKEINIGKLVASKIPAAAKLFNKVKKHA